MVRSDRWWRHKVPPVVAVAAISIGLNSEPATVRDLRDLVLVLVSVVGVAAFGHLVNDWSDIEADARGGKTNLLAQLTASGRLRLVAASLLLGLAPWWWLPHRPGARAALAVEIALLIAYSVPPIRLKARGWMGAVADASYAYAVPFVLVFLLFAPDDRSGGHIAAIAVLATWGMLGGLRGILWHQLDDLEADRAAGVATFAARLGRRRTETVVASVLLPFEMLAGLALVVLADTPWLPWIIGAFLVWRWFQVMLMWDPPLELARLRHRRDRVEIVGFAFANEFVERWLPIAALVALAAGSWWWWLAVAVYFLAFPNAPRTFLVQDLWLIPDAAQRLALSLGDRTEIRKVADRRRARIADGAPALDHATAGRFVFVVCGPRSQVLTLRTAIRHLRPVTRAEIWVLTDRRRNEQVIDIEGVDHLVDVATPGDLDDHQASIWLKTSLHRHLPVGEWCYLDSDIIATVPGVDKVFAERQGPVAFASDLMILENSVDRFSPWAMTCDCLGHGEEHSCGHLREQLLERFGLEVPGDWLHWNGGVFLFGPESAAFLDLWHERAVASFGWPEWKTRDQGALIATVWSLGLAELPRISPEFNFIADLGNYDLCLNSTRGWAHHPSGRWYDPKLLHLYTSPLEDPDWDLGADVEAVVIRQSRIHVYRWERGELAARMRGRVSDTTGRVFIDVRARAVDAAWDFRARAVDAWWAARSRRDQLEDWAHAAVDQGRRVANWARCWFDPRRLTPARVSRGVRRRLGHDVSHLPIPGITEVEPQRVGHPGRD